MFDSLHCGMKDVNTVYLSIKEHEQGGGKFRPPPKTNHVAGRAVCGGGKELRSGRVQLCRVIPETADDFSNAQHLSTLNFHRIISQIGTLRFYPNYFRNSPKDKIRSENIRVIFQTQELRCGLFKNYPNSSSRNL